jgi:hypothetical protein
LCRIAVTLAIVALVAVACRDSARQASSTGSGGAPAVTSTASPVARQKFSALIAPPDVSLEVIFERRDPYSRQPQYFVWRQGNGMRRWDWISFNSGKPSLGQFSIETAFSPGAPLGNPSIDCGWYIDRALPPSQVHVGCGWGGWSLPVFQPLADAVSSYVAERLADRTIAGRTATCYSFDSPKYTATVFCLDPSQGIPLLLSTIGTRDELFSQEMQSISVSMVQQNIVVPPIELEEHPVIGEQGQAIVPISTLQLPDLSEFEE